MVLAWGATVSGLLVLALGATGLALPPVVFAFGATVTALGAIPPTPETALGGTPVRGAVATALGVILALGAPSLAVGPTPPTARPRWAKPTLVSKPSSIPQISIRFIHCPPFTLGIAVAKEVGLPPDGASPANSTATEMEGATVVPGFYVAHKIWVSNLRLLGSRKFLPALGKAAMAADCKKQDQVSDSARFAPSRAT